MTREEQWLNGIAAGLCGEAPLPEVPSTATWHYEQMLAAIYDAIVGVVPARPFPARSWDLDRILYAVYCTVAGLDDPGCPKPTCRLESYWAAILAALQGDDSVEPPAPAVWRIEEYLMSVYDGAAEWSADGETLTGDCVTFAGKATTAIQDLSVALVPVQSGSGTPSAANVRPITGRTGAKAYRAGTNLCRVAHTYEENNGITYTENQDGTVHAQGTATAESLSAGGANTEDTKDTRCLYALPAGTYTVSNISGTRIYVQFRNAGNTGNLDASPRTFSPGNSNTYTFAEPVIIYVRPDIASGDQVDTDIEVMVTAGSTAAAVYEPCSLQSLSADWSSTAGAVYGGSLDMTTGELTVTMANISSYSGETIGEPWLSSMDEYQSGATPTTGAQVVHTLSAPVTYQLSAQEMATLTGANTVWSDAGDVAVTVKRAAAS